MKVARRLDVSVFERWVKAASEFPSILLSYLRSRSCTLVSFKLEFVMNTVQSIRSSNQAVRSQSHASAVESLKSGLLPLANRRHFVTWKFLIVNLKSKLVNAQIIFIIRVNGEFAILVVEREK